MKTAICYYSRHHGNTLRVIQAMAEEGDADLIDVTARQAVHLEDYDCIGFASGVYFGKFHAGVIQFARQYLPQGRPVFFVCTYGAAKGTGPRVLSAVAAEKGCPVLGTFGCRGRDTRTAGIWRMPAGFTGASGKPADAKMRHESCRCVAAAAGL